MSSDNTKRNFSLRVKGLRERDGYTQLSLAKSLHVSQSTIGGWETQAREPTLKGISDLCSVFNTSADYLLGLTNNSRASDSVSPSDSSLLSQLCAAYNLNDTARAMIETIISMPPAEREVVAGLARRFSSALDHDDDELLNRSAEQLDREKKLKTKQKPVRDCTSFRSASGVSALSVVIRLGSFRDEFHNAFRRA
ncbi:MAG: helix-turn-helix transcriptional regulator [Christensenellales bacterium]